MIYIIYDIDNVSQIDFSEVFETSEATLRLSLDGTKTVLKFVGETPTFLLGLEQYNHSEILAIMNTLEWTPPQKTLTKE
tara:strand:- start:131 stop:367 length:237 start_codon:yes stop_codon:yes gene_type:complete